MNFCNRLLVFFCMGVLSTTTQAQGPLTAKIDSFDHVTCPGGSDGWAIVSVTGGVAPYKYLWSPGGGTTNIIQNRSAGTYTVRVVDNVGDTTYSSVSLTQPSLFSVTKSTTPASCACTGSATISVSGGTGGYSYKWLVSGNTLSYDSGLCGGIYPVQITDTKGCVWMDNVTVGETTGLTVLLSASPPTCSGSCNGSATVTASGGLSPYTYAWTNSLGSGAGSTSGIIAQCGDYYTVRVTDKQNCTFVRVASLKEPLPLKTDVTSSPACGGSCDGAASVSVSGGNGGYTYSWSNGMSTEGITGLCNANYTVTVVDTKGCTVVNTAVVFQNPTLSVNVTGTSPSSCTVKNGAASFSASGGSPPYTYTWSGPSGTVGSLFSGLGPGLYTITVTDSVGCGATRAFSILSLNGPQAGFTMNSDTICPGGSIAFTDTSKGVSGSSNYTWEFGDGTTFMGQTLSSPHIYTSPGTYYVQLIVKNMFCEDSVTQPVYVRTPFPATFVTDTNDTELCPLQQIKFTLTSTGISEFVWHFGDGSKDSLNSPVSHGYLLPNQYTMILITTDTTGCRDTASRQFVVTQPPKAIYTIDTLTGCDSLNVKLCNASTPSSGMNPVIGWGWSLGNGDTLLGNILEPVCKTYTYKNPGPFLLRFAALDLNGCLSFDQSPFSTVKINATPNAGFTFTPTSPMCPSDSYTVNFTGSNIAASHSWTFGDGNTATSMNPVNTYLIPRNYPVTHTVTDASGVCSATRTDSIKISTGLSIPPITACKGTSITITNPDGTPLTWESTGGTLLASGSTSYTLVADSAMTIWVSGYDKLGCPVNNQPVLVSLGTLIECITTYSGFTPNGDGKNDGWIIDGLYYVPGEKIRVFIFNRWGTRVWYGENYDNTQVVWKGKDQDGDDLPTGTYYYLIETGDNHRLKGWVELMR